MKNPGLSRGLAFVGLDARGCFQVKGRGGLLGLGLKKQIFETGSPQFFQGRGGGVALLRGHQVHGDLQGRRIYLRILRFVAPVKGFSQKRVLRCTTFTGTSC